MRSTVHSGGPRVRPEPISGVATVQRALQALAAESGLGGIDVGVAPIDPAAVAHLGPAEFAAVAGAVDRRRAEFATGRQLLRSLLSIDASIPIGPMGHPEVPTRAPVSLAHDDELAVAVAAPGLDRDDLTIGVDIERRASFPLDVAAMVLRPDEHGIDTCLAFCAKEAVYKAWSTAGGRFLEFRDVRLAVDGRRLIARVVGTDIDLAGVWTEAAGRCIVIAWLDRRVDPRRRAPARASAAKVTS